MAMSERTLHRVDVTLGDLLARAVKTVAVPAGGATVECAVPLTPATADGDLLACAVSGETHYFEVHITTPDDVVLAAPNILALCTDETFTYFDGTPLALDEAFDGVQVFPGLGVQTRHGTHGDLLVFTERAAFLKHLQRENKKAVAALAERAEALAEKEALLLAAAGRNTP